MINNPRNLLWMLPLLLFATSPLWQPSVSAFLAPRGGYNPKLAQPQDESPIQNFVMEAVAAGAGPGFCQFGLTDASRPFGQHGLAQLLGKVEDRGNGVRSDVTLLAQLSADNGRIFEHEFLAHG